MFGWCLQFKQSCLWAALSNFCLRKQGRKINAMRQVVFEKCIKKSSALSHVKCGEVSLQIEFATLPPKTTTSLWNRNEKGIGKARKMRPQANNAQYNTQGWDMGGGSGVRRQWEGGGGRLLCANLYMSRCGYLYVIVYTKNSYMYLS